MSFSPIAYRNHPLSPSPSLSLSFGLSASLSLSLCTSLKFCLPCPFLVSLLPDHPLLALLSLGLPYTLTVSHSLLSWSVSLSISCSQSLSPAVLPLSPFLSHCLCPSISVPYPIPHSLSLSSTSPCFVLFCLSYLCLKTLYLSFDSK